MWYRHFSPRYEKFSHAHFLSCLSAVFGFVLIVAFLTACGGSSPTAQQPRTALPSTPTAIPTSTPTPKPTPKPTAIPTPKPTPKPTTIVLPPVSTQPPAPPTQPPPAQPVSAPILDVAPSSMSIVGHLDCRRTVSVFVCQAAVISRASNQAALHWVAFANIQGVGFSPAQGSLAPGTRILLTISIPLKECSGTFFFRGPINTHTISWQC